jgi:NADH-quinone oxidoreductase subunit J
MVNWMLFIGLALVAIASAVGMLISRNAIHAALNLIINFITVAVFYLLLGAPFIALTQITVYAGAIMVLFLFVIMLLGAERLGVAKTLLWQRPVAVILGIILLFEVGYAFFVTTGQFQPAGAFPAMSAVNPGFGTPAAVGEQLFSIYLLPFEIISFLLLVAMIGAIVLSKKPKGK